MDLQSDDRKRFEDHINRSMGVIRKRILERLEKKGIVPEDGKRRTQKWFLSKIKDLRITRESIMKDKARLQARTIVGRFYFFAYDPKTKDILPYYDKFPLVIPIEMYDNGFLGLNFHYIHPMYRLKLLRQLMVYANTAKMTEKTRLKLSYPIIQTISSIYRATPCIKRYLWSHVQSRFMEIQGTDWDAAMMLPVHQFEKVKSVKRVYNDSDDMVEGG